MLVWSVMIADFRRCQFGLSWLLIADLRCVQWLFELSWLRISGVANLGCNDCWYCWFQMRTVLSWAVTIADFTRCQFGLLWLPIADLRCVQCWFELSWLLISGGANLSCHDCWYCWFQMRAVPIWADMIALRYVWECSLLSRNTCPTLNCIAAKFYIGQRDAGKQSFQILSICLTNTSIYITQSNIKHTSVTSFAALNNWISLITGAVSDF